MSGHTAQSRFTPWKAGDRILVEAIVESVFDGVSNWPVKILLDKGASATIDASHNVHYSAIYPISAVIDSHAELVKALEEIVKAYDSGNLEMRSPEIGEPENGIPYHEWHEEWLHHARAALATLTARKVG